MSDGSAVERPGKKEQERISAPSDPREDPKFGSWVEFAARTTLHGMKVCGYSGDEERQSSLRRLLLLTLVVLNVVFFLHQTVIRCYNYSLYPSHVDVQVTHQRFLEFPSVTVCNQNNFRISSTLEMGAHPLVMQLLGSTPVDGNLNSKPELNALATENLTEFVMRTSHAKEDLIYSCTWSGEPCDLSEDFSSTVPDFFTLCYTYNWNRTSVKKVYRPGVAFSLRLKLNIESYEYTNAVRNNLGVKVLIHPQSEIPQVGESGFSVPPGTHTLVAILPVASEHLPQPYGTCVTDAAPRSSCFAELKRRLLEEKCGCSNVRLDQDGGWNASLPICNVTKAFECASHEYSIDDIVRNESLLDTLAECSVPCSRTSYLEEISYARLSRLNVPLFMEKERNNYEHLRNKLRTAKAASDTINAVSAGKESVLVKRILEQGSNYLQSLEAMKSILTDHQDKRQSVRDLQIPDHRLTTDERLTEDLKYLIEDYSFKKGLVQKPQPDLHYFTLFVKLLCGFTEREFWIDEGRGRDSPLVDPTPIARTIDNSSSTRHGQSLEHMTIERLLDRCAGEESGGRNASSSDLNRIWEKFYSCDDDDIFTYLGVRKAQLKNAESFKDEALDDLKDAVAARIEASEVLFANTSYDRFLTSERNSRCLEQMEKITSAWIGRTEKASSEGIRLYLSHSTSWSEKLKIFRLLRNFVTSLETSDDSVFDERNFAACDWNLKNDSSLRVKNPFANSEFGLFFSYVEATEASFKTLNSLGSRLELSAKTDSLLHSFGSLFANLSSGFEKFLGTNLTKRQLLRYIGEFTEAIRPLTALHQEMILDQTSFLIKLTSFSGNMYQAYSHMTRLPLPILNDSNFERLSIISYARERLAEDTPPQVDLVEIPANVTRNREESLLRLLLLLYEEYESSFERCRHAVDWNFKMFMDGVAALGKFLTKASADPDLDENFFRENMVKLDVFFKDIKLKKIQQKPSTTILALFSEIGSGMSLLLGASVLTFCEVVDFVALLLSSKVKDKMAGK